MASPRDTNSFYYDPYYDPSHPSNYTSGGEEGEAGEW